MATQTMSHPAVDHDDTVYAKAPGHSHPYHLVEPSAWPLLSALSALVLTVGTVLFMHDHGPVVMFVGLGMLLFCSFGWWRDIIRESYTHHTPAVQHGLRLGMGLFITSEVMFFVAFFWAFFDASIFPKDAIGNVWPPKNIKTLDPFDLPYLNTLLLLLSGTTVTWAHHELLVKHRKALIQGLGFTILLGVIFSAVQAFEYMHAPFAFKDGVYASTFYMATGFHGAHVIIGTIFLFVCFMRARGGDFTPNQHVGFEAAAWYWHFVDVVWLFLFVSIYWWGSGAA